MELSFYFKDLSVRVFLIVICSIQITDSCKYGEIKCLDGTCVARYGGVCVNEDNCTPAGLRRCDSGHCYHPYQHCDGWKDCPWAEDERNCSDNRTVLFRESMNQYQSLTWVFILLPLSAILILISGFSYCKNANLKRQQIGQQRDSSDTAEVNYEQMLPPHYDDVIIVCHDVTRTSDPSRMELPSYEAACHMSQTSPSSTTSQKHDPT